MKAYVTGATGFIGGALSRRLLADGWTVRVLARAPERARALAQAGAELVVGDVERPDGLEAGMRGMDVVFHAAAHVDVIKPRIEELLRTNVEGTRHVLGAARRAKVGRVVYFSSVAAIGRKHQQADESVWHDGDYASPYEESKHKAEQVALELGRGGLDVVHVLPSVVIGPGDPKSGSFIVRYLQRKIPVAPATDGTASFVHVDDLVEGALLAHRKGRANERYIFSQVTWTTSEVLGELHRLTGVPPPRRIPTGMARALAALEEARAAILGRPPRVSRNAVRLATMRFGYVAERARRELGWRPRDFRARFADTVRWWQEEARTRG